MYTKTTLQQEKHTPWLCQLKQSVTILIVCIFTIYNNSFAFNGLDEAADFDAKKFAPVFDMDGNACYPSPAISKEGITNPGLETSGSTTGGCRDVNNDLKNSNTFYRRLCVNKNGNTFCGHLYTLYFKKDQTADVIWAWSDAGHRHDWEYVVVWTQNSIITHVSTSAHGKLTTKPVAQVSMENGHPKIVYHKDYKLTRCMRLAKSDENAENELGIWYTPTIVDWYKMKGDENNPNYILRKKLSDDVFGDSHLPLKPQIFTGSLTESGNKIPTGYPKLHFWEKANRNDTIAKDPAVQWFAQMLLSM